MSAVAGRAAADCVSGKQTAVAGVAGTKASHNPRRPSQRDTAEAFGMRTSPVADTHARGRPEGAFHRGQKRGMSQMASAAKRMFNGIPTRMKSRKR